MRADLLIANDQEWTARAVASIFDERDVHVRTTFTGREAVREVLFRRPDVLILDRQLPDISGPEVCRLLRQDQAVGDTLPIIITTAGPSGRAQRLEAANAGAWDFFGQPLDAEALLLKVRAYAAAARAHRQDCSAPAVGLALLTRLGALKHRAEQTGHHVGGIVARLGDDAAALAGVSRPRAGDLLGVVGNSLVVVLGLTASAGAAERMAERWAQMLGHPVASRLVYAQSGELPEEPAAVHHWLAADLPLAV